MLNESLADSTSIAKKVLAAVDSTITETTETAIKAQRNRHIGVFVGSGGEELFITLKPVSSDKTFVTVATKTGFVGGAGQKAWSCQVVIRWAPWRPDSGPAARDPQPANRRGR